MERPVIRWWTEPLTRIDVIEYENMRWERTQTDVLRSTPRQLREMRYWQEIIDKKGNEGMFFLVSNPEALSALRFYPKHTESIIIDAEWYPTPPKPPLLSTNVSESEGNSE